MNYGRCDQIPSLSGCGLADAEQHWMEAVCQGPGRSVGWEGRSAAGPDRLPGEANSCM